MSRQITRDHIKLKEAAALFKQSVRNLRKHCKLPSDHHLYLRHLRGPGGHIYVLPEDIEDWVTCKGADWKKKHG
jgi:hypothetical protein